jgi:hypothetical protein
MVLGFGFGSPLTSILMLIGTSLLSYFVFRVLNRNKNSGKNLSRDELRQYYYEQRRRARDFSAKFDLTDEEIEKKIDNES